MCKDFAVVVIVTVITFVAALGGALFGYNDGKSEVRNEAVDRGIAEFVTVPVKHKYGTGYGTEFRWRAGQKPVEKKKCQCAEESK